MKFINFLFKSTVFLLIFCSSIMSNATKIQQNKITKNNISKVFNKNNPLSIDAAGQSLGSTSLSFGTPNIDNNGATWAYLVVPVLGISGTIKGHLQVSTDANFASNVITTSDTPLTSSDNEIWQMVNKLQPNTNYYYRGVVSSNGQTLYSNPGQLNTPAIGSSLATSYDSVTSQLSWKSTQLGSPDPTYAATAYINWGHSTLLGHTSNKVAIPQGQTDWMPATFQQQDGTIKAGDTIYWQYVITSNGESLTYTGPMQTSAIPRYYVPASTTNPCGASDANNTAHRVAENVVLICSNLINYNGVFSDDGQSGELTCPVNFPFNLNYTKQLTISVPKLGIPLGPFGESVSYWRSSSNVRFNLFLPGANAGFQGAVAEPGWQKWSAANWDVSSETAQYWIYCGNYLPPPGTNIYNGGSN